MRKNHYNNRRPVTFAKPAAPASVKATSGDAQREAAETLSQVVELFYIMAEPQPMLLAAWSVTTVQPIRSDTELWCDIYEVKPKPRFVSNDSSYKDTVVRGSGRAPWKTPFPVDQRIADQMRALAAKPCKRSEAVRNER